jgi:hypothetical protein
VIEELVDVGRREHGREQGEGAQVKLARGHHAQYARELAAETCSADAQVGLGFREVQRLHAVFEHRGEGVLAVEAARVDLAEVHEQARAERALPREQASQAGEQRFVAERCNVIRFSAAERRVHARLRA